MIAAILLSNTLLGDGWVHVDAVRASGFERVAEGQPHAFTIVRSKGDFEINCSRDIAGALAGVLRTEVGNENGIFTWIAGNPHYVLRLDGSTAPEWVESLLPAKFTSRQLKSDAGNLQRSIGKKVSNEGEDEVASRDCFVVSIADETPLVQNLWIDEKTGMVLRQMDSVAKQVVYERRLSSFEPDPLVTTSSFTVPPGAVIIRGLASPQILSEAAIPHSSSQYDVDLQSARSSSVYAQGGWIKKALTPPNFTYMGTSAYDLGTDLTDYAFEPSLPEPGESVPGIPTFGSIPAGWTEAGQVVVTGGRIYFGFPSVPDFQQRGLLSVNAVASGATSMVQPAAYMAPDGSIYSTSPTEQSQNQAAPKPATPAPVVPVEGKDMQSVARSEFLDLQTGDTVTFVQFRNLPLRAAFPGIRLPGPEPLVSTKFSNLNGYEVPGSVPMKAVEWRGEDDTEYVLISTSLGYGDLAKIAERA